MNLNDQTVNREGILSFVMHRIRHSRDNEKNIWIISGTTEVIIRLVELSDEFTDRDNYNELILYFIPLGKFFF